MVSTARAQRWGVSNIRKNSGWTGKKGGKGKRKKGNSKEESEGVYGE